LKDLKVINDFISLDSKFYAYRFINRLIQRVDQTETCIDFLIFYTSRLKHV